MNKDDFNIFKKIKNMVLDFEDTMLFAGAFDLWREKYNSKKQTVK